ncbi:hypothetical protein EIN_492400 [Entamoeba invadens IP1]|uniref:Uncharacterized protein n=1 Tax=Entamoeba invadens IP1 TaxID=370355 RepID=A0A0A1U7H1_ENTIV|nr:hypothetical protein EIN_492400 [Entamoeba invadens IP1]ELP88991.1 hypothetical protein EIN_492400 [Entamoeba invadens IP1]|eukprot:XP_004255762.1 hypothetical protein EIN_492400 [Entamoeba invadens IP1]
MDTQTSFYNCDVSFMLDDELKVVSRFAFMCDVDDGFNVKCGGIVVPQHLCVGIVADLFGGKLTLTKVSPIDTNDKKNNVKATFISSLQRGIKAINGNTDNYHKADAKTFWSSRLLKTSQDFAVFKNLINTPNTQKQAIQAVFLRQDKIEEKCLLFQATHTIKDVLNEINTNLNTTFTKVICQGLPLPYCMDIQTLQKSCLSSTLQIPFVLF